MSGTDPKVTIGDLIDYLQQQCDDGIEVVMHADEHPASTEHSEVADDRGETMAEHRFVALDWAMEEILTEKGAAL